MDKKSSFCRQCSLCVGDCPVFSVYREEPLSAKGRVILEENKTPIELIGDFSWECRVCGLCQKICPSRIPHVSDTINLRKNLTAINKVSEECTIIKTRLKESGNPFGEEEKYNIKKEGTTLLWLGCTARNKTPGIINPTVQALEKMAIDVAILEKEGCCGALEYFMGDIEAAAEKTQNLINVFSGFNEVITPCAKCYVGFKTLIPMQKNLKKRNARVPKITHLIEKLFSNDKYTKPKESSFFQFPCRLLNFDNNGIFAEYAKKVVGKSNLGSLGHPLCCGGECHSSTDISKWRVRQILQSFEGEEVVTGCPGCYLNFSRHSKKRVRFITES